MLVVVLHMPEHSSFQDMLFPMLFISKYAKSYAINSIMDISLTAMGWRSISHRQREFDWCRACLNIETSIHLHDKLAVHSVDL